MQIELLPAAASDQPLVAGMMQLYLTDLRDYGGPPPDRHAAYIAQIDEYWTRPGCCAFLVAAGGRFAGFALAHQRSRIHGPFDGHALADFFIKRAYRRQGVGTAAAIRLFDHLPGRWELSAPSANVPATAFIRSVSQAYTGGFYEEIWYQHETWRGTVESFHAPPRACARSGT